MKSRQITKGQYDEIGTFLATEYVRKNKLVEKHNEMQKKIDDIMVKDLPDIVRDAYKQYPNYFVLGKYNCSFSNMIDARTDERYRSYSGSYYPQYRIDLANKMWNFLKEKGIQNDITGWSHYGHNISGVNLEYVNFVGLQIADHNSNLNSLGYRYNSSDMLSCLKFMSEHEEVVNIVLEYMGEYAKYKKFCKQISCAFSTITTTNMLKNEIPEAYEFFYKKYGKTYEEQDEEEKARKKKEKKAQCDQIEALRASIS